MVVSYLGMMETLLGPLTRTARPRREAKRQSCPACGKLTRVPAPDAMVALQRLLFLPKALLVPILLLREVFQKRTKMISHEYCRKHQIVAAMME